MSARLAYLPVGNVFAAARLLPMGEREKDVEILAVQHQVTVRTDSTHVLAAVRQSQMT